MYSVIATLMLVSCKKAPERTIERGTWKITSFNDNGKDVSANFTGYNMEFLDDGTVKGGYNQGTFDKGVWSYNEDSKKITVEFPISCIAIKFNFDWSIKSRSRKIIQLEHFDVWDSRSATLERN